jgi:hypothetical protein
MKAPVDKEQWSESSKRSYAYDSTGIPGEFYEDIAYTCLKCSTPSVFPGVEQKTAYEVKKNYVWKRRILCNVCFHRLEELKKKDQEFQKRWEQEKTVLSKDYRFLCDWLSVLKEVPSFGKRKNECMINMLRRLAHECT